MARNIDVNKLVFEPVTGKGASTHALIAQQVREKLQALTVERKLIGFVLYDTAARRSSTPSPSTEELDKHMTGVAMTRSVDRSHEVTVETGLDTSEEEDRDLVERYLDRGWELVSWDREQEGATSLLVFQRPRS